MARPPSPFVVVGRMGNVLEANLAAAKLRGEGINAQVEPTNAYALSGLDITLNDQGVAIMVPESQVEQAEAVLEEFRAESSGASLAVGEADAEMDADAEAEEAAVDEPAAEDEKEADYHLSWGWIILILLAVIAVGFVIFYFGRHSPHPSTRPVWPF